MKKCDPSKNGYIIAVRHKTNANYENFVFD